MRRYVVQLDGKDVAVWAERLRGALWFHYNGRTYSIADEERRGRTRALAGKTHPGRIAAPMPGKVTKVLVGQGQEVKSGEPLVVMEAMKMEYTLASDIDGRAKSVSCSAGDQVSLGQVLVVVVGAGETP